MEWPEALPYVNVWMSTCLSYRKQPTVPEAIGIVLGRLNGKTVEQLKAGVLAGNADDAIDLALRFVVL